jgi:hypothetical protein
VDVKAIQSAEDTRVVDGWRSQNVPGAGCAKKTLGASPKMETSFLSAFSFLPVYMAICRVNVDDLEISCCNGYHILSLSQE